MMRPSCTIFMSVKPDKKEHFLFLGIIFTISSLLPGCLFTTQTPEEGLSHKKTLISRAEQFFFRDFFQTCSGLYILVFSWVNKISQSFYYYYVISQSLLLVLSNNSIFEPLTERRCWKELKRCWKELKRCWKELKRCWKELKYTLYLCFFNVDNSLG